MCDTPRGFLNILTPALPMISQRPVLEWIRSQLTWHFFPSLSSGSLNAKMWPFVTLWKVKVGDSLVAQCLGLSSFTAEGQGLIPGLGN